VASAVLVCLLAGLGSLFTRQAVAGAHGSAGRGARGATEIPLLALAGAQGTAALSSQRSGIGAADRGCLNIPVKIKSVKATAIPGGAPTSSVAVEWEVENTFPNLIIDGFSVTADMRPSGLKAQTNVGGAARNAILKLSGKDDGGTCSVVVTAKGHANLTGSQQVEGRFWSK